MKESPIILLILVTLSLPIVLSTVFSSSLKTCQDNCADRNIAFPLARAEFSWSEQELTQCDYACRIKSCHIGCRDLDEPLSTCGVRCAEEGVSEASCTQGCHAVQHALLTQIQDMLLTASVTVDANEAGVNLSWQFPDTQATQLQEIAAADVVWMAQSRPSSREARGWRWTALPPGPFRNASLVATVQVPLEPAAHIEVRLALSWRGSVLVSRAVSYQLSSDLLPPSVKITHHLSIGRDRVAVCWKSNHGESAKFRVQLTALDGTAITTADTDKRCGVVGALPASACRVSVTDVSREDKTAEDSIELIGQPALHADVAHPHSFVHSNGTHVVLEEGRHIGEGTVIPIEGAEGETISAVAAVSEHVFLAASEGGAIWLVNTDNDTESLAPSPLASRILRPAQPEQHISHMVYEPMQNAVYCVLQGSGILRCSLTETEEVAVESVETSTAEASTTEAPTSPAPSTRQAACVRLVADPLHTPTQIAVDGWNGFIYYLTTSSEVYQSELFPHNATNKYTFETLNEIKELASATAIDVDLDGFQLLAAVENGTILSRNLASGEVRVLSEHSVDGEEKGGAGGGGTVRRLRVVDGVIHTIHAKCDSLLPVEADGSGSGKDEESVGEDCVFSQAVTGGDRQRWPSFVPSSLVDLCVLSDPPPLPALPRPERVTARSGIGRALIEWTPSERAEYQAPGAWRSLRYEVRVLGEDGSVTVNEHTDATRMTVPVRAGAEYRVTVRACWHSICSADSNTTDTAFIDLPETPVVYVQRMGDTVIAFDLLGNEMEMDETVSSLQFDGDGVFVYDNTTKTVYTANHKQIPVSRVSSDGNRSDFLSFLQLNHLAILPSRSILVMASAYQIVSSRLTSSFDHLIYTCPPGDLPSCGEVAGLASDDASGEILFLLRLPDSRLQLWSLNQEQREPSLLAEREAAPEGDGLPELRQLVLTNEKLLYVSKKGDTGSLDRKLKDLNQHGKGGMQGILQMGGQRDANKVSLLPSIQLGEKRKGELTWQIDPALPQGHVLYKISLFRDSFASGESSVFLSLQPSISLPSSVIQQWKSGERFDVRVDGVTAWTWVWENRTGLVAPVKPPSAPTQTSIYATQQKTVDGARAIISFFWQAPAEWNGMPYQYVVNCSSESGGASGGAVASTVQHYTVQVKSGKMTCSVAAANEPGNVGDFSTPLSIDSSELKPLVRLFAIDSTNALIAITNLSKNGGVAESMKRRRRRSGEGRRRRETFEEKRRRRQLAASSEKMEYEAIASIENDLFAVRKEPEQLQPLLVQIDTNDIGKIVHKVSIGGDVSRIEAMTSDWVGNRLLFVSGTWLMQLPLDPFLSTSVLTPRRLIQLSAGASDAKQLTFDPFKNTAYLLTRNGSLFSLNLVQGREANLALSVPCLASQTVTWMMSRFAWNRAISPHIYALTWNGLIVIDVETSRCEEVRIEWSKFGEKGLKQMSAFSIADKLFVFVTSSEMWIYGRESGVFPIQLHNPPVRQLLAVSHSSQPYPDRSCFSLPASNDIDFNVRNEGRTGSVVEVVRPPSPSSCGDVSLPQTHYEVYFTRKGTDKVKHIRSFSELIHVENGILDKETEYDVQVAWLNRYVPSTGLSAPKQFRTGYGYPSAPRRPQAFPISPDTVHLYWTLPETLNAPIKEISYRITQQASALSTPSQIAVSPWTEGGFSASSADAAHCVAEPCRVRIGNLRPGTQYKFWVIAVHDSHASEQFAEDGEAVSSEATAKTLDVAGTLRPDNVTGASVLLRWNSLQPEQLPGVVGVQYKESGGDSEWRAPANASFDGAQLKSVAVQIQGLLSATSYDYRFVAVYNGSYTYEGRSFSYKEDYLQASQQTRTKAGVPTAPVSVSTRRDEHGLLVEWKPPLSDGGSPITSYAVEFRQNASSEWEISERGLDSWKMWWRPPKAQQQPDGSGAEFRVRAANQEGFGPYTTSADSEAGDEGEETGKQDSDSGWIITALAIFGVLLLLVLLLCIVRMRRASLSRQKQRRVDDKMITLEKMNTLASQSADYLKHEIKNLPQIERDAIVLGQRLGKGLFGEVFEGTASDLPTMFGEQEARVAVKTLRSGYSENERLQFLREAVLMNNLDHPNLVSLLGVVVDGEPHLLVMELMHGDLLSFLRASRPTESTASKLHLRELLNILIDVCRGGAYLEQLRHVHRDLAARNCLISLNTPRVTKIADFGMARQVGGAEGDSFRVRGEDNLPVRWLAPECISNGEFSSASDVWAFGVLCWEVLTLGHIPYASNDNQRVVQLVTGGQCLGAPKACPDEIYRVMLSCWKFDSAERPSFANLLQELEEMRERKELQDDRPFPPVILGEVNEAFEKSIDSSDSDREYTGKFGAVLEKSMASSTGVSKRPSVSMGPSMLRSLRTGKAKPSPLPTNADLDAARLSAGPSRSPNHLSVDWDSRPNSIALPPNNLNHFYYECDGGSRTEDCEEVMSRSWAGRSGRVSAGRVSPPPSSSRGPAALQARKARGAQSLAGSTGSYVHPRGSEKVSQVSQV